MRPTLLNRLSLLLVLSSVLFIAVFVGIQVIHQQDVLERLNRQKANFGAFMTKNALDASASFDQGGNSSQIKQALWSAITPLKEAGVVDQVTIFSKAGEIVDSSDQIDSETELYYFKRLYDLLFVKQSGKSFFSMTDAKRREIHTLISISEENPFLVKLRYPLGTIGEAISQIQIPIFATTVSVILINLIFAFLLTRRLIHPVSTLNKAARELASGNFNTRVNIQTSDELEELGCTFNFMALELRKLQLQAENVNPLTKLPGNILIQEEVEKRIKKEEKFVVMYADLNNFKTFNDKFGLHHGDLVINLTAEILKEAIRTKGTPEDFVGHEGGDDFVIVTTPENADAVAQSIIQQFNEKIKSFFSKGDLERSFYTAFGRDGLSHQFPIMGIALAGVTNENRYLENYAKVTQICAEVKKGAKAKLVSTWLLDHRFK